MLDIYYRYAQHINLLGPVEFENFRISADNIGGVYLDYAVAISSANDGLLVLDFLPDGALFKVLIGSQISDLKSWSPTSDTDLARKIIAPQALQASKDSILEALRNLVRKELGDSIEVPRMKKYTNE
jgi:hypothetical protein